MGSGRIDLPDRLGNRDLNGQAVGPGDRHGGLVMRWCERTGESMSGWRYPKQVMCPHDKTQGDADNDVESAVEKAVGVVKVERGPGCDGRWRHDLVSRGQ